MGPISKLRFYLGQLDTEIKDLIASPLLMKGEIPDDFALELRGCCIRAMPRTSNHFKPQREIEDALRMLLPAIMLITSMEPLARHPELKVRQNFAAIEYYLGKIDNLAQENGTSFFDMDVSHRSRSIFPWVEELLEIYREINETERRLTPPFKEKYGRAIRQINHTAEFLDLFLNCNDANLAYEKKVEALDYISRGLAIATTLPPSMEKLLQKLWTVLLEYKPPEPETAHMERDKQFAERSRQVFFFSQLAEQVPVFQQQIKLFNQAKLFHEYIAGEDWFDIKDALDYMAKEPEERKWQHQSKEEHMVLVEKILQRLMLIMPKLDLNPNIAKNNDLAIRIGYEACWCIANNIARNAELQYGHYDYALPEHFPDHPLIARVSAIVPNLPVLENKDFAENMQEALKKFKRHTDPTTALEKKEETINQLIFYMMQEYPVKLIKTLHEGSGASGRTRWHNIAFELDALAAVLSEHGSGEQREKILQALNYSEIFPRYVFKNQPEMPAPGPEFALIPDAKPAIPDGPKPFWMFLLETASQIHETAQKLPPSVKPKWALLAENIQTVTQELQKHPTSLENAAETQKQRQLLLKHFIEIKTLFHNAPGPIQELYPGLRARLDKALQELGGPNQPERPKTR